MSRPGHVISFSDLPDLASSLAAKGGEGTEPGGDARSEGSEPSVLGSVVPGQFARRKWGTQPEDEARSEKSENRSCSDRSDFELSFGLSHLPRPGSGQVREVRNDRFPDLSDLDHWRALSRHKNKERSKFRKVRNLPFSDLSDQAPSGS